MGRIDQFGILGGIAAAALIAHLWMFPSLDGQSAALHAEATAPVAATADTPLAAACPGGMAACIATGVEDLRLPLGTAISTLPALLWGLHRRPAPNRTARRSRHGPGPPLSPVEERVLLLE